MTHTPDWIRCASVLHDMGDVDDAIDVVMDAVSDLADARRLADTNAALGAMIAAEAHPDLLLTALTATRASLPVRLRGCLTLRPAVYDACRMGYDALGRDADAILGGLQ